MDKPYFCDDCITSPESEPCSCRVYYSTPKKGIEGKDWKWLVKDTSYFKLDSKGKPYPCHEYDYEPDGYDTPTIFERVKYFVLDSTINLKIRLFKKRLKKFFK